MTYAHVPASRQLLSDRLSQWLGWTDAIALSTALNGEPPRAAAGAQADDDAEQRECDRVRAAMVKAVEEDRVLAPARHAATAGRNQVRAPAPGTEADVEYSTFRQRYVARQQAMETAIGNLRTRLRAALAVRTPAMMRLALVDAVLERALSAKEYGLLATVPGMLEGHFRRLREAEQAALAQAEETGEAAGVTPGAWLEVFRKDMRSVLHAELEIRLQPVEGLMAALRASQAGRNEAASP